MDDYLLDRDTLGKFVDELMKKKAIPVNSTEELNNIREKSMKTLDDRISTAIFAKLNEEQLIEINQLFDREEESPDVFRDFFTNAGINLEDTISDTMQTFAAEFLGGQNA